MYIINTYNIHTYIHTNKKCSFGSVHTTVLASVHNVSVVLGILINPDR